VWKVYTFIPFSWQKFRLFSYGRGFVLEYEIWNALECYLSGVYYNGNWTIYFMECTINVYIVLIWMLKVEASNLLWLLAFGTQIPHRGFSMTNYFGRLGPLFLHHSIMVSRWPTIREFLCKKNNFGSTFSIRGIRILLIDNL
jgi:hypothetical protein